MVIVLSYDGLMVISKVVLRPTYNRMTIQVMTAVGVLCSGQENQMFSLSLGKQLAHTEFLYLNWLQLYPPVEYLL